MGGMGPRDYMSRDRGQTVQEVWKSEPVRVTAVLLQADIYTQELLSG